MVAEEAMTDMTEVVVVMAGRLNAFPHAAKLINALPFSAYRQAAQIKAMHCK
jgi:hypothetical protein